MGSVGKLLPDTLGGNYFRDKDLDKRFDDLSDDVKKSGKNKGINKRLDRLSRRSGLGHLSRDGKTPQRRTGSSTLLGDGRK